MMTVLMLAWLLHAGAIVAAADAPADLLNTVVLKNEAARAAIRSYAYTIAIENQRPDGPPSTSTGDVKRRGDDLYAVFHRTGMNRTAGVVEDRESRVVVNAHYAAFWPMKGNPLAYRTDHASIAQMDQRTRGHVEGNSPPEILPHCFGDADRPFRESVHLNGGDVKYDAVEARGDDGQLVYHLRRFMPTMDDPAKPDSVWIVNPRKGHLATDRISYKQDGKPWIERHVDVSEIAPGVWFPIAYEEKHHGGREAGSPDAVTLSQKVTLKNVVVNEVYPDAQFELGALRLKEDMPDVRVLIKPLDGRAVSHVFQGDQLVRESAARKRAAAAP
jgi:hypothetical protein